MLLPNLHAAQFAAYRFAVGKISRSFLFAYPTKRNISRHGVTYHDGCAVLRPLRLAPQSTSPKGRGLLLPQIQNTKCEMRMRNTGRKNNQEVEIFVISTSISIKLIFQDCLRILHHTDKELARSLCTFKAYSFVMSVDRGSLLLGQIHSGEAVDLIRDPAPVS